MGKNKKRQNIIPLLRGFMNRINGDHVSAYSAQAAYFLILSFIPFMLFLTTIVRYTPLSYNMVSDAIRSVVPHNLQSFVLTIVSEVYDRSSAVLPVSAVFALWSAGKGIQALTNGLNTIYHVKETRNWLMTRIYSIFYTVLFCIAVIATLLLLVLGDRIQAAASVYIPVVGQIIRRIIGARTFLVFSVLFFIFLVLYKVLPNRKASYKSQAPGAFIIAIAWSMFSYFFSIYFEIFPNINNMYGSMTALIMLMLWLYVCMNLMLYGAEMNAYFEKQFRLAQESVRDILAREKESEEESQ